MNRNEYLDKAEIENELKTAFGLDRVLWLDFGQIIGDDTDSHVDTLARFCSPDTIAYVSCEDINDPQYEEFSSMMLQLQSFRTRTASLTGWFPFLLQIRFTWTATDFLLRMPTF